MHPLSSELLREASAELARLRRIRGPGRRTARRIARARLVIAAALLGAPLGQPALARTPIFVNLLEPFGLGDVGGHSAPAFADLDGDGDLDAFVGETYGSTIFFENTGTASVPAFAAPATNPFGLLDVGYFSSPAFADVDGDGDLDAFAGDSLGNTFLSENTGTPSAPAFAGPVVNPFGLADAGFDSAPSFADLDGDGDLDALVGEAYGDTLFFENTGDASTPAFAAPVTDPFGLGNVGTEASPGFADLDGDGDLDAFLGGGGGDTVFFENTGTASVPAFAPRLTNPFGLADVGDLAAPAFADLDGDGDLDAFLGSFAGTTLLFANTGSSSAPAFLGPIQLPDVGRAAAPTLTDLDGDGDLDVFLGTYLGDTIFVANTGSANAPAFTAPLTNPFGLDNVGGNSSPAFADLDGDGDLDAFVGRNDGHTLFFENTATGGAPGFAAPVTDPFGLAVAGVLATPTFADLDGDGDLDAFVGEGMGNTLFSQNTGSASAPGFAAALTDPFGLTDVGELASPALADLDGDGDLDAFLGDLGGDTVFFENTGTASVPAFAPRVTNPFGLANVGGNASPSLGDIDGDGDLDAFVGEREGNTIFFLNLAPLCPAAPDPSCKVFGAGSLSVDERKAGNEKLTAKLAKGPELAQAAFGDPTAAGRTTVALCLYDAGDERVAALPVDRAGEDCGSKPCWKPIGKPPPEGQGFSYKDAGGSANGVRSLKLRGGAAGRSQIAASLSNLAKKGESALPTGIAAALAATSEVTLQVQTSDALCFGATLSEVVRQESGRFKAR